MPKCMFSLWIVPLEKFNSSICVYGTRKIPLLSISDTLTNASLKLNGVSDGMISYNRVVELLLQWYGEKEEF